MFLDIDAFVISFAQVLNSILWIIFISIFYTRKMEMENGKWKM